MTLDSFVSLLDKQINTCKSDIFMSNVFVSQMPECFQTTNKILKAAIDENTEYMHELILIKDILLGN